MTVTTTTQHDWFTNHVSALMACILTDLVVPDDDGDIPVRGETAQGWVRVEAREPWGVRVFAHAARGVPAKAAVFREMNAAMSADRAMRVTLQPGGCLVVDYLLLADAATQDNLRMVVTRVLQVADELGVVVATVHGGRTPFRPQSAPSEQ